MNEELKTMHLFAGAGGGILADLILGHRPIVAVEWDKYACEVLRARVADGWFNGMSVWEGDVQLFDPSDYKGRVDCIHAGFPCQDISSSGRRSGVGEDTRSGLYREVLRIADVLQPRYLFLENVSAIVTGDDGSMLRTVTGDLADRGYDAPGDVFPLPKLVLDISVTDGGSWPTPTVSDTIGGIAHDTQHKNNLYFRVNKKGERWSVKLKDAVHYEEKKNVADSNGARESSWLSEQEQRQERDAEIANNGSDRRHGWTRQGYWSVEPTVGRVVNGMADRSHRIKALGNGQVPLQCATAFKILWEEHNAIKTASRKGGSDAKGIDS